MADEAKLDAVLVKVQRGEKLSRDEFSRLEAAVRRSGEPSLKLAVGHALVDANEPRTALPLLEALVRDHPRVVEYRLGLARALSSLERYGKVEQVLEGALAIHPGDPEVLKAKAIVALVRGEVARARALVAQVLGKDPLDSEAQMLHAELESGAQATPAPASPPLASSPAPRADPEMFERALEVALDAAQVPHLRRGRSLLVKVRAGRLARVGLDSLYESYQAGTAPLEEAVVEIARELTPDGLGFPDSREELLAQLMPVLREHDFADRAIGPSFREGPAGLLIFYVVDHPDLVRYVPVGLLEDLQVAREEADARAFANLSQRLAEPRPVILDGRRSPRLAPRSYGLWALCEADGYDAARLLVPAQYELLAQTVGAGPFRVSLARRELVLACRESDVASVKLLDSLEAAPEGISGRFRLEPGGELARADA